MRTGSTRLAGVVRQAALTVGAVAGVLCILVTLAAFAFGVRPLVFQSGSMSPSIDTGALALARETRADDLRLGDIVSLPTGSGQRVTHRVVSVEHQDGSAVLRLKGDANEAVDVAPYRIDRADVVLFAVPEVGYVLGWLASPVGIFALGLYAAFLVSIVVRGTPDRRAQVAVGARRRRTGARHRATRPAIGLAVLRRAKYEPRHRVGPAVVAAPVRVEPRRRKVVARHRVARPVLSLPLAAASTALTVVALVAGTLALGWTEPTLAAWSEPATVSGVKHTAYTVPAPSGTCAVAAGGTTSSRGVNLTWPANLSPLPLLSYTPVVTGITSTSNVANVDSNTNKQLQVRYNPSTVTNQNKIVTVTATPRLTSTASWTGPVATWKFRTGGNNTTPPTCGDATPAIVEIRAPDGVTRTPTAQRAFVIGATGCTADITFCGTIEDASTIASVTYVLRRTQGATVRCFDGGAWVVACNQVTASSTVYQGQLTFYEDATTGTVYPNTGTGSYTLTVTVTDSWQNVTTAAVSFTLI